MRIQPLFQADGNDVVAESRRTLSVTAEDVVKCIQAVDTDDADAMKQAAIDLVQQVCHGSLEILLVNAPFLRYMFDVILVELQHWMERGIAVAEPKTNDIDTV